MITFLENRELLKFVQMHLACTGHLCQRENGYLYLKISDDFIRQLFQFIDAPEKELPDYFSESNYTGAHISVAYPEEADQIMQVKSVNSTYTFGLGSYFKAEIRNKLYFGCTVESPALAQIRAELGLSKMLNFKGTLVPFHFTIATKKIHF
jgi:hypothetical protein